MERSNYSLEWQVLHQRYSGGTAEAEINSARGRLHGGGGGFAGGSERDHESGQESSPMARTRDKASGKTTVVSVFVLLGGNRQ